MPCSIQPSLEEFSSLTESGNVIPIVATLAADFETPLSAFAKLRDLGNAFLLESAESTDKNGRWSILGAQPRRIYTSQNNKMFRQNLGEQPHEIPVQRDVLGTLEHEMRNFKTISRPELPPFIGGLVGFLAYDAVRQFEPSLGTPPPDTLGIPDATFLLADTLLVFDHRLRKLFIVANAFLTEKNNPLEAYQIACSQIHALIQQLEKPLHLPPLHSPPSLPETPVTSNTTREQYQQMVTRGQEYIKAGDIFQFVPSQRFSTPFHGSPLDLYRALRHINPSPYMFILEMNNFSLVGSSPEVHVRSINGRIDIRPIAGTRKRGQTPTEDDALAADLLADPKECAEHLMLVDLARNDVGRIAQHGSVKVDDFMIIERYSHVMHIVSNVTGTLNPTYSAYDVLRATFPAGTVSGAPKIRAMQIINEFEINKRCTYAGAIGYFGFDGNHDSCITLRTCLLKDKHAYVQAGAGVVADSSPTSEFDETVNKAKAVLRAVALAKTLTTSSPCC